MKPSCLSRLARGRRGFTLLELVIVIAVVCFMLSIVLDRLLYHMELAEKVAAEQIVGILRSSLHLQTASLIARGKQDELRRFADQNPMDWLAEKPKNYAGEVDGTEEPSVASGRWIFNKKNKKLIYVVHNGRYFRTGNNEPKQLIFRVKLLYGNHSFPGDEKMFVEGVVLEQANTYSWFR